MAIVACSPTPAPHRIDVVGAEYAFAAPDTLPAGPAEIHYRSGGAVAHEMVFVQLRDGVEPSEFAYSLVHDRPTRALRDGGSAVLFSVPGQRDFPLSVGVTLIAGRHYAIHCQFSDSAGAAKHQTLGMFKLFVVR